MLLIEEFLERLEEALKERNTFKILTTLKVVDDIDDPVLEDEEAREKLELLVDYLTPIKKLPEERRLRRIGNALGMVERYRSWFLVSEPECGNPKDPDSPIKYAKGVGPAREKVLKKLGIERIGDLVWYVPRDYEDRRKIIPIGELKEGKFTTRGRITSIERKKVKKVKIVSATLSDGMKTIVLKWFNQDYVYDNLISMRGKEVVVTGMVKRNAFGFLEMNSPEVVPLDGDFKR